jgi:hypothetical protein
MLVVGTLVLSLALWVLFWKQQLRLDGSGTLVVVGLSAALIAAGQAAVTAWRRRRTETTVAAPPKDG